MANEENKQNDEVQVVAFKLRDEEYGVSIEWLMGFDVDKNVNRMTEVIVADSEMFAKLLYHMSREDYTTVMDIFSKTYQKMKAMGIELH